MAKKQKKKKQGKGKSSGKSAAATADKYELYGRAVQEADHEAEFFDRNFKKLFGHKAVVLREDFCGTFAVCCEWAKLSGDRRAMGVDLDPEPLRWGLEHNLTQVPLKKQVRVELHEADVRCTDLDKAEILAAQNFSFWIFKTRDELREYFQAAYDNIADQGVFFLDMMGGGEVMEEDHEDVRKIGKGVTYIWEQERFNPINHHCRFHISFKFKDGSELKRAFTYDWRMWTLPEVREILEEVGFDEVLFYWEDEGADGEGTGVYRRRTEAPSDPTWIAYVAGIKGARA